jgi:hypothetical protein
MIARCERNEKKRTKYKKTEIYIVVVFEETGIAAAPAAAAAAHPS